MPSAKRAGVDIDLRDFSAVGRLFADHARRHYGACASFCFRKNRPRGQIVLKVKTDDETTELAVGVLQVTKAMRATLGDEDDAAEHGAYGVALLVAAYSMGLRFVERSSKGTGFDFYVAPPHDGRRRDDDDIFGDVWGFEVSGIFSGDTGKVRGRLRKKQKQVAEAVKLHPVLIVIVEFSKPTAVLRLQRAS